GPPVRLGACIRQNRGACRRPARTNPAVGRGGRGADPSVGLAVRQVWFERDAAAFEQLKSILRARYPRLHAFIIDGQCPIRGTFAAVERDRYALEIALPTTYPQPAPRSGR